MTKAVLVTGASGFIGAHIVPSLVKSGWTVRAAARKPEVVPPLSGVEAVALPDLSSPADWTKLLDGMTHALHLAGVAHAPGMLTDDVYRRINAEAAGELARAARGRIQRLVLMSSVRAQAGLAAGHVIIESDVPRPTDTYGRTKLEAERLVAESGVSFTVLRPAVVYGKGVKGNIAALATLAQTPMPLPFGALDNRRSLLAIANLATAIDLALTAPAASGETYLVADPEPISVAELVSAMREGLGRSPHLVRVPAGAVKRLMKTFGKEADFDRISGNFVVDAGKLHSLGWQPSVRTHEGIVAMMRA